MIDAKKKKIVGGSLLLSASLLALASCDTFYALPDNYMDPILNNEDGTATDVYNNIFNEIYDAIALGQTDRILDEFMYIIAKDQFGDYETLDALFEEGASTSELAAYAKTYPDVFTNDNDDYLLENATYTISEDELLAQRVSNFYERIQERIREHFYDEVTSGSYSDRSKYEEKKLAMSYYSDLYDIEISHNDWYEGYISPEFTEDDVSSFVHLDYYEDYINRALIPEIYRSLLVEQFLYDDYYSTLGRAYGRNVDIIELTSSTTYTTDGVNLNAAASRLLYAFADTYILEQTDANAEVDFEIAANAWRGFQGLNADGTIIELSTEETQLLEDAGFTTTDTITIGSQTITYYTATQLGILLDQYQLIDQGNRFASDAAEEALATFTNNNTYSKETGLLIQLAELALTDYTTDGWYVRTDGLSDLPDSIRNRLFNISVSTEIDNFDEDEMETYDDHTYDPDNYVRYINNNYYLTPATSETAERDSHNFVMYESGSSYIVKINEAVATSKLSLTNDYGYFNLRPNNILFTEETAFDIAEILASRDTYTNSAYEKYIDLYSVTYHDSNIFDYFESTFPDLFDD